MYIEPNTNIKLLANVPLDNTYEHTIYFGDPTSQYNYFASMVRYNLTNNTYQRHTRGVARVGYKADDLYNCNYMMFQNTSFGNKWFYAFITNVEYVNNVTSDVTFEIDVMQTWHFDYHFRYCFIKRQHSVTDRIGENLLVESIPYGDYVQNDSNNLFLEGSLKNEMTLSVLVVSSEDFTGDVKSAGGSIISNVIQGCNYYEFDITCTNPQDNVAEFRGLDSLNDFLNKVTDAGKSDSIVNMFMVDAGWLGMLGGLGASRVREALTTGVGVGSTVDGYKPKNNKLLCYPYNILQLTDGLGNAINLRFEYFNDPSAPKFYAMSQLANGCTFAIAPASYKTEDLQGGYGWFTSKDYSDALIMDKYPICSFTIDSYRAWLAQNQYNIGASVVETGMQVAVDVAGGRISDALKTSITSAVDLTAGIATASMKPNSYRGNLGANYMFTYGAYYPYTKRLSINASYAKMIDDYFSAYGYLTNQIATPNRSSRPHWNYTQTGKCTIEGSIPADDSRKICDIYNRGITWWKHPSEVGDYSLDNSPA